MDGISTMILSDADSSMTPLFGGTSSAPPTSIPFSQGLAYSPSIPEPAPAAAFAPEKSIGTPQMDSTPISDIMGQDVDYAGQGQYMAPPQTPAIAQQAPPAAKKGPMNMTPEQMEALLAGVAAVIAFAKPVQEKLTGFIPQMLSSSGEASNIGLLVTALVAALIFYFGRRFVK